LLALSGNIQPEEFLLLWQHLLQQQQQLQHVLYWGHCCAPGVSAGKVPLAGC
jgi:hypothetical protein